MRQLLTSARRFFREYIGWHRIGIAVSLAIIAIAISTLVHQLRDIDIAKVIAALRATPAHSIAWAAIFVVAGYVTLTFYDLFALRTIGRRDVPYRIAALASFTSYSIGHNVGATVFTGGMVRFHIYSAWALTLIDVAKIAFVTGLTFWLGNTFVLGVGMAYAPEAASAINQLPAWFNRSLAIGFLAAIAVYLAWLSGGLRVVGRSNWRLTLPGPALTLVQIGLGVLDLGCGALAMHALLPNESELDFVGIAIPFVMATLLGFVSHAPGSLGVFDAAMLVALRQYEKEELLAALLLFRLLYFMIPFAFALMALGLRALWLNMGPVRVEPRKPPALDVTTPEPNSSRTNSTPPAEDRAIA
jgi:uncharacterized membrane protein YbhN (UPF0104 family)